MLTKAALQLCINYSTAKTIMFLFRRQEKLRELLKPEPDTPTDFEDAPDINSPRKTAGFRQGEQKVQICTSIGGTPDTSSLSLPLKASFYM